MKAGTTGRCQKGLSDSGRKMLMSSRHLRKIIRFEVKAEIRGRDGVYFWSPQDSVQRKGSCGSKLYVPCTNSSPQEETLKVDIMAPDSNGCSLK